MDPSLLLPAPDPISVAPGWFEALRVTGFFAHLLLMNTVLGASLIALALEMRTLVRGEAHRRLLHAAAEKIPTALALAVNAGVVPLLFLQVVYGHLFYTSSVLMAWSWLGVVGLVLVAYYGLYVYDLKYDALARLALGRTATLGVVAGCLLVTAFFFVNNMTLMLAPEYWTAYFKNPDGTLLNLADPTLWPRYVHFVLGSLAVGGLGLALLSERKREQDATSAQKGVNLGLRWFGHATFFQLLVGLWFLGALPERVAARLLAGGAPTLVLAAGVACGLLSLLFAVKKLVRAAALATLVTLGFMVALREFVRTAALAPYFSPADLTVAPQYSPMLFFFASLAVGLACIAWMLRLAATSCKEQRP